MTSQRKKQTVSIHILPNISKIKDNQTVKFCLLIEYSMRNIFLEKSYIKCDGETISKLFQKKKKSWAYLWMNSLKIYEVFLKNKKKSGTSPLASYSALFLKKNIYLVIFY